MASNWIRPNTTRMDERRSVVRDVVPLLGV